ESDRYSMKGEDHVCFRNSLRNVCDWLRLQQSCCFPGRVEQLRKSLRLRPTPTPSMLAEAGSHFCRTRKPAQSRKQSPGGGMDSAIRPQVETAAELPAHQTTCGIAGCTTAGLRLTSPLRRLAPTTTIVRLTDLSSTCAAR